MEIFIIFGKYAPEALKEMSKKRTENVEKAIKKLGGEVISMYALLGETDLVFIVNFPGVKEAMKASVVLNKMTGISFTTAPAMTVKKFDQLISDI
jgi:uncharacterized protein with GYD domain